MKTLTVSTSRTSSVIREAISYGRFSSEKQGEQDGGDSIRRQSEAFKTVCERYQGKMKPSERFEFGHFFGRAESGFQDGGQHLREGGSLRKFLDLLRDGTIDPHKTVLVIEMWSRFGRIAPDLAVSLLSDIVRSGCVVAVANPDMWVDASSIASQNFAFIAMLVQMAHSESADKSRISKINRENIRQKGLTKDKKKVAACPCWLVLAEDGKGEKNGNGEFTGYKFSESNQKKVVNRRTIGKVDAATLKQACIYSIEGKGQSYISQKTGLRATGLTHLFRQRSLIGELTHETHEKKDGKRIQLGTKEGYYPSLLTHDQFKQLQDSLDSRRTASKKRSVKVSNLFPGITFNQDGEVLGVHVSSRGDRYLKRYINKSWATGGTVRYALVENAILDCFLNLKECDLFPEDSTNDQNEAANLKAKIEDYEAKIVKMMAKADADTEEADTALEMVSGWKRRVKEHRAALEAVEKKLRVQKSDTLAATQAHICDLVNAAEGEEKINIRAKLRAIISRTVKRIEVQIHDSRSASIAVTLVNNTAQRIEVRGEVIERKTPAGRVGVAISDAA